MINLEAEIKEFKSKVGRITQREKVVKRSTLGIKLSSACCFDN